MGTTHDDEMRAEGAPAQRFDAAGHMRKIRTRQGMQDYLDVKWRVAWIRADFPAAQIITEQIESDKEHAHFRCVINLPNGAIATGHGSETVGDFGDFYEKAETKAVGRACATLGYGTDAAADFDDGEPMDGRAAAKDERAGRRMEPEERAQVDAQHERNTASSNLHQHAQLRSIAEHGFDLAPCLAALGVATIEELSREQAMELIVAGRQSVRGDENAPTAPPPRQPSSSTLPATRNHPQQPDGQDRARANIEAKMRARGLPVLPMDSYEDIAETVNNALRNAGSGVTVRLEPGGVATAGAILNALMALPSAVPTNG